ncbi:hypothetical protein AMTR_s00016p00260030 [Amborella trichopoda]|uniref:Uncharacterized protein n=1 Tax=Amborella trichopoda TaxID=13333 RepID=W1PH74_AMBTC|nr:hypothetical protein AMTR_s00016p00260030 [Amborella trichopoda]
MAKKSKLPLLHPASFPPLYWNYVHLFKPQPRSNKPSSSSPRTSLISPSSTVPQLPPPPPLPLFGMQGLNFLPVRGIPQFESSLCLDSTLVSSFHPRQDNIRGVERWGQTLWQDNLACRRLSKGCYLLTFSSDLAPIEPCANHPPRSKVLPSL